MMGNGKLNEDPQPVVTPSRSNVGEGMPQQPVGLYDIESRLASNDKVSRTNFQ